MAHFYGWSHEYIARMDGDRLESYWRAITVIENQSLLLRFMVADYPNLTTHKRNEIHRNVHREAFDYGPKKYVSKSDAMRLANG